MQVRKSQWLIGNGEFESPLTPLRTRQFDLYRHVVGIRVVGTTLITVGYTIFGTSVPQRAARILAETNAFADSQAAGIGFPRA